ncbi:MAG: hypothetical protein MRQ07_02920 [Candidatus Midichloria sp.]|nr:hypothetical protein [Candidatus Midichloria sp.]
MYSTSTQFELENEFEKNTIFHNKLSFIIISRGLPTQTLQLELILVPWGWD